MKPVSSGTLLLALGLLASLSGCPGLATRPPAGSAQMGASGTPAGLQVSESRFRSVTGCEVATTSLAPKEPRTQVPVILAHGFLRDQRRMEGLAKALASAGIPTFSLSFCNSRPWDGGHRENAADMRQLAASLGAAQVIYAGFSAGGLSALIAGREDPKAIGVLALDLVDDRGIGASIARDFDRPLLGLAGEPAACNAGNNGLAVYAASRRARVIPIPGASHCDFESPTDWLCRAVCGGDDPEADARRAEIIRLSVAAVGELLGLEPPQSPPRR